MVGFVNANETMVVLATGVTLYLREGERPGSGEIRVILPSGTEFTLSRYRDYMEARQRFGELLDEIRETPGDGARPHVKLVSA